MAIELWAARLERPLSGAEETALLRLLPPERRKRLERVALADKRREALCAYAVLLQALRERYHWREFPRIELSSLGKPFFPDFPDVQFNLSHTAGAVLVGLSDQPVGVDIEKIRPVSARAMRQIADVTSERAFFQRWVRREARAKRTGSGIGTMLEGDTPLRPGEHFWPVETFQGYVAGVASHETVPPDPVRKYSLGEWGG